MNELLTTIFIITFSISCKSKTEFTEVQDTYFNGNTKSEFIYPDKSDKQNYTIKNYYENGQLSFTATVENGMLVGQKISYYYNGKLKEVDSLIKPCELNFCCCDGTVTKYKPNGQLEQSYQNRNGVANGLVTLYDDSTGKVDVIYTYVDDRKNGTYTSFYPGGQIYSKGTYRNDSLIDFQYFFKENGDTLKYNYTFKGKQDFPYKKWLDNGEVLTAFYSHKYDEVTYVWYNIMGNEVKRQVAKSNGKQWAIPE